MESEMAEGKYGRATESETPWQLKMFSKTLKKQQKLKLLLRQIGDTEGKRCLLVTNGDNNGAFNFHMRNHGGIWTWVENEDHHIEEMEELLGESVLVGSPFKIPCEDASFDVAVSVDVHEHLDDCGPFTAELRRTVRPGGMVVVTTPNGDPWKPVTILKNFVGMTKEKYGHKVIGYNVKQHERMLERADLRPVSSGSYSKFFTEMIELMINFAYVMVLARKSKAQVDEGTIAPGSSEQLKSVEKQYRLYSSVYPILNAVSKLDHLLFFFTGYAVSVVARKAQ
jgi:SAM-dependent methyltransferase